MLIEQIEKVPSLLQRIFNKVYCSSKSFIKDILEPAGVEAEWLVCPPPDRNGFGEVAEQDLELAFIGNADPAKDRNLLTPVFNNHKSGVYGGGWGELLEDGRFLGDYLEWLKLPELWNRAKIVPYSTHRDMKEYGFVADACLDVMANSNALVLPDHNDGFEDLDVDAHTWGTADELEELVSSYLENDPARLLLAEQLQIQAKKFTYKHVAERLLNG